MTLPPPAPVAALITLDDRGPIYRLGSSRVRLRVAHGRRTVLVDWQVANHGQDPHDATIRRVGGRALASSGLLAPLATGRRLGRLEVALRPGRYVLYCSLLAGTKASHELAGMHRLIVVRG